MCIAIASFKGNDIPCEEFLRTSFINNDDGAGFAFNTDDRRVQIVKGLMTWEAFKNTFYKYHQRYNFKERGVLIHFRITTHGGTRPECCHPFPVLGDIGAMKKLEYATNWAAIHNGIISLTSGEATKRGDVSDTMVFIEKYLSKIATNKGWFKNETNYELLYDMLDSKMAVINGHGDIHMTYGFTQDADGNYYSNTSYKYDRTPTYHHPYSWGGAWDEYDADGGYSWYSSSLTQSSEGKEPVKKWVGMQRLQKGQTLYLDDGSSIDFSEGDPYIYLLTRDGNAYLAFEEDIDELFPKASAIWLGTGEILDDLCRVVPFQACLYLRQDRFDVYDDECYDSEPAEHKEEKFEQEDNKDLTVVVLGDKEEKK